MIRAYLPALLSELRPLVTRWGLTQGVPSEEAIWGCVLLGVACLSFGILFAGRLIAPEHQGSTIFVGIAWTLVAILADAIRFTADLPPNGTAALGVVVILVLIWGTGKFLGIGAPRGLALLLVGGVLGGILAVLAGYTLRLVNVL